MPRLPRSLPLLSALIALAATGCQLQHDPAKKVTIEVSGVGRAAQIADAEADNAHICRSIEQARQASKKWTESKTSEITWSAAGDTIWYEVTPVTDVEAFAESIEFGKVTAVDGRTIKVRYSAPPDLPKPKPKTPTSTVPALLM